MITNESKKVEKDTDRNKKPMFIITVKSVEERLFAVEETDDNVQDIINETISLGYKEDGEYGIFKDGKKLKPTDILVKVLKQGDIVEFKGTPHPRANIYAKNN